MAAEPTQHFATNDVQVLEGLASLIPGLFNLLLVSKEPRLNTQVLEAPQRQFADVIGFHNILLIQHYQYHCEPLRCRAVTNVC